MRLGLLSSLLILAIAAGASVLYGHSATNGQAPGVGALLVKLKDPIYPPIARTAHILGDVKLVVQIRRDGTLNSVQFVSGPPLLKQAAMDSAQESKFECDGCTEAITPYSLVYTFQFSDTYSCDPPSGPPEVTESHHHIWVTTSPIWTCDPVAERRVRSIKCLYLWKCGRRRRIQSN